ncbi:hypothetical protein J6590_018071 [Homalodisca vitripennis]|nr:hypothetical protein J6590_018071 [Homalodisca vitripennis]
MLAMGTAVMPLGTRAVWPALEIAGARKRLLKLKAYATPSPGGLSTATYFMSEELTCAAAYAIRPCQQGRRRLASRRSALNVPQPD